VGSDLANLNVKSISQVTPDPKTGDVRITVNAERRMTLEGSLDDPHIRELLVNTVKSYENPGIRRDALDALQTKSDHPAVREALIFAMRKDPNAGDRLDALKAIQNMDWGSDVHQALLAAAEQDDNPGVRFAAMDTLVNRAVREKDTALLPVLQSLATGHSNPYIRVRCAQAIHELTADRR
jgi:HEAT repeats